MATTASTGTNNYPARSAGAHLLTNIPTATPNEQAQTVRDRIVARASGFDTLNYLYVLDDARKPVGVISVKELLRADAHATMDGVMRRTVVTGHPYTSRGRIAQLAISHNIKAVPIVDRGGVLLGAVGTDTILETLHREHVEDVLSRAGIQGAPHVTDVLRAPLAKLIRFRLPWLLLGLIGAMGTTVIVRAFNGLLEHDLRIAFFIPLIVYMAAAVGIQTQTLYIRALAIESITFGRYLARELAVTFAISIAAAALLFGFTFAAFRSTMMAGAVSIALIIAIVVATLLAIAVTTLLTKLKRDPALGGGPVANAIQDAISLLIYLAIAWIVLL